MQLYDEHSKQKNDFSKIVFQLYKSIKHPHQGYFSKILTYLESDEGVKKIFTSDPITLELIISGITKAQLIENAIGVLAGENVGVFPISEMMVFIRTLKNFEKHKADLNQFFDLTVKDIYPKEMLVNDDYKSYMENLLQKISEFVLQYSEEIDKYLETFFALNMVMGKPDMRNHTPDDILKLYSTVFAESLKHKVIKTTDLEEYIQKISLLDHDERGELISSTLQNFVQNQDKTKIENEIIHLEKVGIITSDVAKLHLTLLKGKGLLAKKPEQNKVVFSENMQHKKNNLGELCTSLILNLKKLGINTELLQENYMTSPVLSSSKIKHNAALIICNLLSAITYIYLIQSGRIAKDKIDHETLKTLTESNETNGKVQSSLWPYLKQKYPDSEYIVQSIKKIDAELDQLLTNHWQLIKPIVKKIKKKGKPDNRLALNFVEKALSQFKIEGSNDDLKKQKKKINEPVKKEKSSEQEFTMLTRDDPIFGNKHNDNDENEKQKQKELELQKAAEIAELNKIAALNKTQQEPSKKKKKSKAKFKKKNKSLPHLPQDTETKVFDNTQADNLSNTKPTVTIPDGNDTELHVAKFALSKKETDLAPKVKTKRYELPKELQEANLALEALISIINEKNSNQFDASLGCLIVTFNFLAEFCLKHSELELKDSNFLNREEISQIRNLLTHQCIYADNSINDFIENLIKDFKPRLEEFNGKFLHRDKLSLLNSKFVKNLQEKKKANNKPDYIDNLKLIVEDLDKLDYSMKSIDNSEILKKHLPNSYVIISFLFKLDVRTKLFPTAFKFNYPELVYFTSYYRNQIGHPTMTFKDPRYAHDPLFVGSFTLNYEKIFNIGKKVIEIKKLANNILNKIITELQKPNPKKYSTGSTKSENYSHNFFKDESRQQYYAEFTNDAHNIETEKQYAIMLTQFLYSSLMSMKTQAVSSEKISVFHMHLSMLKPQDLEMLKKYCDKSTMQLLVDLQQSGSNFNPENFHSQIEVHLDKLLEMTVSIYNVLLLDAQPTTEFQNG